AFYRTVYESIPYIYTITSSDYLNLEKIVRPHHGPRIRVLGNPRYDEVKSQADQFTERHTISVLLRTQRLVVGSVWPEDQAVIIEPILTLLKMYPALKLLWVPHEPSDKYVQKIARLFETADLELSYYKSRKIKKIPDTKVVIVTSVGVLSRLYWQGQFAYVGGGFSTGVHNVMEPAIARLPVFFGPKNQNSPEAQALIDAGGGQAITRGEEFYTAISRLLEDKNAFLAASLAATDVIHKNLGSATRVVRSILRD
ncbi:MAG: 3-deoxy-D-manno-octulosonic acid transferase, partial [Fidelibacterota bacterium]